MKKQVLIKTKLDEITTWMLSLFMISIGTILIALPIVFWDFLVYEQFKPTVRPFYPVFYGSFVVAGIIIAILGILGSAD